eukprot:3583040-Pleurochrysis_carterae.AAC.8
MCRGVGLFKATVPLQNLFHASLAFLELAAIISPLADSGNNSPSLHHMLLRRTFTTNHERMTSPTWISQRFQLVWLAPHVSCTLHPTAPWAIRPTEINRPTQSAVLVTRVAHPLLLAPRSAQRRR